MNERLKHNRDEFTRLGWTVVEENEDAFRATDGVTVVDVVWNDGGLQFTTVVDKFGIRRHR